MNVNREKLISAVEAFKNGDQDAFTDIYEQTQPSLFLYASYLMKDQDQAEDLTQDAYIQIMNKLGTLQDPGSFMSWSKTIIYHLAMDEYRSASKGPVQLSEDEEFLFEIEQEEDTDFLPEEKYDKEELKDIVLNAMQSIPPEQSITLIAYYYDNMSIQEIAQMTGAAEGTIKTRLFHGRKKLRAELEKYEKKTGIKLRGIGFLFSSSFGLFDDNHNEASAKAESMLEQIQKAYVQQNTAFSGAGETEKISFGGSMAENASGAEGAGVAGRITGKLKAALSIIVAVSIVAGGIGISYKAITGKSLFGGDGSSSDSYEITDSETQKYANLSNGGMACQDGDNVFIANRNKNGTITKIDNISSTEETIYAIEDGTENPEVQRMYSYSGSIFFVRDADKEKQLMKVNNDGDNAQVITDLGSDDTVTFYNNMLFLIHPEEPFRIQRMDLDDIGETTDVEIECDDVRDLIYDNMITNGKELLLVVTDTEEDECDIYQYKEGTFVITDLTDKMTAHNKDITVESVSGMYGDAIVWTASGEKNTLHVYSLKGDKELYSQKFAGNEMPQITTAVSNRMMLFCRRETEDKFEFISYIVDVNAKSYEEKEIRIPEFSSDDIAVEEYAPEHINSMCFVNDTFYFDIYARHGETDIYQFYGKADLDFKEESIELYDNYQDYIE